MAQTAKTQGGAEAREPSAVALLADAASLAAELPELLVAARDLATTIVVGQHGRRRAGPGEDFWQYRAFVPGESASLIDWRRSARDDHLYVREFEWEASQTVWFWVDTSLSMAFSSDRGLRSKRSAALILALATADCLARGGERIGVPGLLPAATGRARPRRIGEALVSATAAAMPPTSGIKRHSDVVIVGDFLDERSQLMAQLDQLAETGARAHLIQLMDPIEESFPYRGRTEFVDPETGGRYVLGRADSHRQAYQTELARLRAGLAEVSRRLNWSFFIHRTDVSTLAVLGSLMGRLADRPDLAAGHRAQRTQGHKQAAFARTSGGRSA